MRTIEDNNVTIRFVEKFYGVMDLGKKPFTIMPKISDAKYKLSKRMEKLARKRHSKKKAYGEKVFAEKRARMEEVFYKHLRVKDPITGEITLKKPKYLLVLDIDGTVINYRDHAKKKNPLQRGGWGLLYTRPYLKEFLEVVKGKFEIFLFTSGTEGHLRYVWNKFFKGVVRTGFSRRWNHKLRKDPLTINRMAKNVVYVDDDESHYHYESADRHIPIARWTEHMKQDRELLRVLDELEDRFPELFIEPKL